MGLAAGKKGFEINDSYGQTRLEEYCVVSKLACQKKLHKP
jgi:hypothetical protein